MKQSDLLFVVYGGAFLLMLYLLTSIFYKPEIVTTPITTVQMWPWSIPYNYWPKWNELTGNLYKMADKVYIPQKRPWGDSGI